MPVPIRGYANLHAPRMPIDPPFQIDEQTRTSVPTAITRGTFTEISTIQRATLMIFLEMEDKKYIHICPMFLLKCAFDLRPAVNPFIAKYAIVLTPTLLPSQFSLKDDPFLLKTPQVSSSNDEPY